MSNFVEFRGRKAVQLENEFIRVTITVEGGHIAEIYHKEKGVNPLWQPPWTTIEPSKYAGPLIHPEYGNDSESKLLSGIMGHNLCLDLFGAPSQQEALAGLTVHGEASINTYSFEMNNQTLAMSTTLEAAQLEFKRRIQLDNYLVKFNETVQNLSIFDRQIAYTQHVTLGPPFLQHGKTKFHIPGATQSRVYEIDNEFKNNSLMTGKDFTWPSGPGRNGESVDLRVFTNSDRSSTFTTHLMENPAYFTATTDNCTFGYRWNRDDYPWLGIWEENCDRHTPPWCGKTITRGMEFGVSPFPESRRQMIERRTMFGTPTYKWIPAKSQISTSYEAFFQ